MRANIMLKIKERRIEMTFRRRTDCGYGSSKGYEPLGVILGTTHDGEVLINIKHHMKKKERDKQGYKRRPVDIECNKKMLAIYVENDDESIDLLIKVCEDLGAYLKMHRLGLGDGSRGDSTEYRE